MTLREQAVRGLIWSATSNWGEKVISFVTFLVISRLLDPEAFGLVALASVFTAFAQIFLDQGFADAIVQRAELEVGHLDTAFWVSMLSGGLLLVIGFAAAEVVAALFKEPALAPVISWLSWSFLFGALSSTQRAILRRKLDFKGLAMRSLIAVFVSGLVGIGCALWEYGVWSLVAQQLVYGLVGVITVWRVSEWRPGMNVSWKHFRELFIFGVYVVGSRILEFFSRRSDDFLIGYFLGPVALGYYTVAYRLLLVMINVLTGITTTVAFSTFSRLQHEPERVRRAFYQATLYTSMIAFPVFLGMLVLAPELVITLFGAKWAPSIPVMRILALIGILFSVLYFNGSVIKSAGKPAWHLGIMLLNATLNVIAFTVAVRWGIEAVALAYVIVSYLVSPISFLAVHRLIQIDFAAYFGQFVAPLLAALAMVGVIGGLKYAVAAQLGLPLQLALYLSVGGLSYLLVLGLMVKTIPGQMLQLVTLVLPSLNLKKT